MFPVFIYTLLDPRTGEIRYAGQTVDPDIRLNRHMSRAKKNRYHSGHWISALLDLGLKPIMEILDVVPDNEADFWEMEYIQNFRERGFDLTNFSDGGEAPMRGKKHTPETRVKMSDAKIGACFGEQNGFFGKTHSVEACSAMSAARKGKKLSPEICEKRKGRVPWNKGIALTLEHRAAISAGGLGKKHKRKDVLSN